MTEFYIPTFTRTTLPSSGREIMLFRGIHAVPDELANHADGNGLGIKPVEEMTDDEWAAMALDKESWMKARAERETQPAAQPVERPVPAPSAHAPAAPITIAPATVTVTPVAAKST